MNGISKLAVIPIKDTILKIIIIIEGKTACQKKSDRQVKFEIKMLSLIFEKVLEYFLHSGKFDQIYVSHCFRLGYSS